MKYKQQLIGKMNSSQSEIDNSSMFLFASSLLSSNATARNRTAVVIHRITVITLARFGLMHGFMKDGEKGNGLLSPKHEMETRN